jgi:hypothetical protein
MPPGFRRGPPETRRIGAIQIAIILFAIYGDLSYTKMLPRRRKLPIVITLAGPQQRAQAIRAIETAVPRARIVILDPALSDQQLKLLRILAADLLEQATPKIQIPMAELERLLTAGMFCDQGMPGYEPGTWVVRGLQFEELTVAQASDCAEYVYSYGAARGIIFREKKPS